LDPSDADREPRDPTPPAGDRPLSLIDGYNVLRVSFSRAVEKAAGAGALDTSGPDPGDPAGTGSASGAPASGPSGWWTEPRRRALVDLAARACRDGIPVWVVFDGARAGEAGEPGIAPRRADEADRPRVVFTSSADDWIVRQVKRRATECAAAGGTPRTRTIVVTADRPLAGRSRHHGAAISSPDEFVKRCLDLPPREP